MSTEIILEAMNLSQKYELDLYPKRDLVLVRGQGAHVWDVEGKEYIDCVGGQGSANVGHCHPKLVKAIQAQAERLMICPSIFYNDSRSKLVQKLVSLAPPSLDRVFLCNSGTESMEAAIKFARISTGRPEFVCAVRGFHGRTMGALSATHNPKYRAGFEPLVPGFKHVPYNQIEALEASLTDQTAGLILEVVQGEGGVYVGSEEYFKAAEKLCRDRGIMFILDEVQTGFCRTGKMFAFEHYNLEPDLVCLAKSIAGGFPMGAVLCSRQIKIEVGSHGTTFGGNPLACRAALAAIEIMQEENLAEAAQRKGDYVAGCLRELNLPRVREVRHMGLIVGIQLKEKSKDYIIRLMQEGILVLPAGPTVIRLLPPLCISYDDLDAVVAKIARICS